MPSAPAKLPTYTRAQFRSNAAVETRRDAQAITIRALPVNNSAPPTITRISPSETPAPRAVVQVQIQDLPR